MDQFKEKNDTRKTEILGFKYAKIAYSADIAEPIHRREREEKEGRESTEGRRDEYRIEKFCPSGWMTAVC